MTACCKIGPWMLKLVRHDALVVKGRTDDDRTMGSAIGGGGGRGGGVRGAWRGGAAGGRVAAHRRAVSVDPRRRGAGDHGIRARAGGAAADRWGAVRADPLCDGAGRAALAGRGDADWRDADDRRLAVGRVAVLAGVGLGSGPLNSTFEASKWRRYRVRADAAGSIATRKVARARDRSHFGVASRFDRFCPWLRRKVLKYPHIPTPFLLALCKIASNLERGINGF